MLYPIIVLPSITLLESSSEDTYQKEFTILTSVSEDIVKSYNALSSGDISTAYRNCVSANKNIEKSDTNQVKSISSSYEKSLENLQELEVDSSSNILKTVINDSIFQSEDEEEIEKFLKLRVAYTNSLVTAHRTLLQLNMAFLGIVSKEVKGMPTEVISESIHELDAISRRLTDVDTDILTLEESVNSFYVREQYLNEALVKTSTVFKLLKFVVKAIAFIAKIYKAIVHFVKLVISKIKEFFGTLKKVGKWMLKSPLKSAVINEAAKVDKVEFKSFDEFQRKLIGLCDQLSRKIQQEEQKQSKQLNDLKDFLDKKYKSTNESYITDVEYKQLMLLI